MNNYFGTVIKKLRKSKSLTQHHLSKGICSVRQLSRIELNNSTPSALLISEFHFKLGNELYDYLPYSDDPNAFEIKNEMDKILNLFNMDHHHEAFMLLEKSKFLKNTVSPYAIKEIAWIKGALSNYIDTGLKVTEDYYKQILMADYKLKNINEIFDLSIKPLDYRILNSLNVLYLEKKDFIAAEDLMKKCINNYEKMKSTTLDTVYLRFVYNLSRLYLQQEKYEEAIALSQKGIDYCIKNSILANLPDLSNILGRALHKSNNPKEGNIYLNTYINLRRIINPDFDYQSTIDTLKETYKVKDEF